jgi:RND family efflux transporter MFP subunit
MLMHTRPFRMWLSCSALAILSGTTCLAAPPPKAPVAKVATGHEDFTGRTEAAATVELRARVTGYLDRVLFKDGAAVKKDEVLFEIDPRPYRAELDRADAALTQAQARRKRAEAEFKRADTLFRNRTMTREEYDKVSADYAEAQAGLRLAEATRDVARLHLDFTKVTAPVSGRIGRRLLDPGNLVKADDTALATLVRPDSLYVYFDVDERTALRLRQGKLKAGLPVAVGLAGEQGFPHRGTVDFVDNRVDAKTGTLRVRAVLANAEGLLMPGLFARVRLFVEQPHVPPKGESQGPRP